MRVVFACAGTGGHINPAIAIANMIKEREENSEFLFIGTQQGLENKLVKQSGYIITHIRTGKIIRSLTLKNIKEMFNAYRGISDAKKVLKNFKPDLVIGTGGYICVPVMLACTSLKIPYLLHESNSYPGISVKLLSKKAFAVMVGFEDTKDRIKHKEKVVFTGTPAKFKENSFHKLDKINCLKELSLSNINKKIVLVTCGSQGAKKINETLLEMVKNYQDEDIYYILVTGDKNYEEVMLKKKEIESTLNKSLDDYIKIERFIYEMDKMYKVADLCVTRAGAMTVTELAISKKKAILIPLPTAAENHQYYNAKILENAGSGKIIEQKDLDFKVLHDTIKDVITSNDTRYVDTVSKVIINDVDDRIYKCIINAIKSR